MFTKHYDDFYGWTRLYQHAVMCSRKTLISYADLASHVYNSVASPITDRLFGIMEFNHFIRNINGHDQYRNQLMIKMPYNYAFTVPDGIWQPVIR